MTLATTGPMTLAKTRFSGPMRVATGRICETELARQLAVKMGTEPDLRCYLLDISHPLLVEAFKHAAGELKGSRTCVSDSRKLS
jgi:hypothetical protein